MSLSRGLSRREFFALAAAGAAAACSGGSGGTPASPTPAADGRLSARPQAQQTTRPPGLHQILSPSGIADGAIYVPRAAAAGGLLPFAVMLHGGGGTPITMDFSVQLAEEHGVVLLLPQSRARTWDAVAGPFGADVTFVNSALAQVFSTCAIDPARVTLGGLSDGATYALALGLPNGDLFTKLIAFSPGFLKAVDHVGRPRVYISHGIYDATLNIDLGSRTIVPALRAEGYDVTYREFEGGHWIPDEIAEEAFDWLS